MSAPGLHWRLPLLTALLFTAGACSDNPRTEAAVHFVLDVESIGSGCQSALCTDYGMTCGATVSLRLTDPESGALLTRSTNEPLSVCLEAPISEDICSLADLAADLQLFGVPAQTVRVEVALWNDEDLVPPGVCPNTSRFALFDILGRPQTTFKPQPAFAGAAYFRAGEQGEVTVPLACPNADRLSIDTCAANLPTDVAAAVTDIETMQALRKEQAPNIAVSVGQARAVADDLGGSFFVLEAIDTFSLPLNNLGATPVFEAAIPRRFGNLVCTTTLEGAAQATTTAFCEEAPDRAEELKLGPVLIRKEIVDAVIDALALSEFPDGGLVIGRVVDESFSPAPGVVITPEIGNVLYLSNDLSNLSPTLSSDSAYFVATDVPFGSQWTASHFDGRRHSGSPRGGIISGKVSAVIIRMTGDVIEL